jgi:hypothetical protein
MHSGTISSSERWIAGHHVVPSTITLGDNVVVTIEGCSDIKLGPDASIHVTGTNSQLVAEGSLPRPVHFLRSGDAAWGRVLARGGSVRLAHTTLEGGGGTTPAILSADFLGATLAAQGTAESLPQSLHVDNVSVIGSTGVGLALVASRFTAESARLTVRSSGSHPMYLGADALSELPAGEYTGNAIDEILLHDAQVAVYGNDRPIVRDTVAHARGVPYRVGINGTTNAMIRVGDGREDGPAAVLFEIEPGVTMKFSRSVANSGILVQGHMVRGAWTSQGALRAVGNSRTGITFTSAERAPMAGDWVGLYFKSAIDPRTRVDYAVIEYAGSDCGARGVCASNAGGDIDADSAVVIMLEPMLAPPGQFVTNTTIRHSANGGVYRSWHDTEIDFTPTNSFESIAGCRQSGVARAMGGCASMGCM